MEIVYSLKKTGLSALIRFADAGIFGRKIEPAAKLDPNPAFFKILGRTIQQIRRENKNN